MSSLLGTYTNRLGEVIFNDPKSDDMEFKVQKLFFLALFFVFLIGNNGVAENGIKETELNYHEDLFDGFIYFADKQKTALKSVEKRFPSTLDSHQLGTQIIETLIEGPTSPASSAYSAIWPRDTKINAFFISDDGKAFVDLKPGQGISQSMDTGTEILAVYSVVNSLTINIPKIKMVKILIDGRDSPSLAGHIDLRFFYKTNMLIVK